MQADAKSPPLTRRETVIGWILGAMCLAAFLACPAVRDNNGDALGWARYLEEYASAPGTMLSVSGGRELGPRPAELPPHQLALLGERQRIAGWWVLWNPHHLLFLPVTAFLFRLVRQIIPVLGGITFLQWWNALASAATILILYRLLLRIVPRSPYALPWCLFVATSVTFFRYATDGAQYPTPVLLLTIMAANLWAFGCNPNRALLIKTGIWLALAALFHQIVILLVPFLALGIWFLLRGRSRRTDSASPSWAWEFLALGFGIPVVVYVAVAAVALIPTGEFIPSGLIKYATLYAQQPGYWADAPLLGYAINLLTFLGSYFDNERTQILFLSNIWFSVFVMFLPALWLVSLFHIRRVSAEARWWLWCTLLWILPFLLFLSVWVPGAEFYHLFLIVPLSSWTLIGVGQSRESGRRWVNIILFWTWCAIAIGINLPLSLARCPWVGG